jgi:hypothetical protein
LDKRAPISEISEEGSPFHMYYSSNNVLFIGSFAGISLKSQMISNCLQIKTTDYSTLG